MKIKRIVKFNIKKSHTDYKYIKTQLIESKEIYNFANYILRQLYFKNSNKHKYSLEFIDEYPSLKDLFLEYIEENKQFTSLFYKLICEFSKLKQYSINLKIVQNIVDKLKNDWTSYWKLLKMKMTKTYDKQINIPRYKKKYNLVEYNNQVISKKKLKLGYIGTDKMKQGIKIANRHKNLECKCFRIYNKNDKFICELIYEKEIKQGEKNDRVASIDIGLENLFTIVFNYNKKGISIKGSKLKSINQYFNKMKASLQSSLPSNNHISRKIMLLLYKRREQLRNYIGYYTNKLIEILRKEKISKLVVGYNKGWKEKINIGVTNNQNFVSIAFRKILEILKYKLEDNGIEYKEQEESYTSKASYLDNDKIPIYKENDYTEYIFSGKRVKRGLYKTNKGQIINADLNGALNILRKSGEKLIEPLEYLKFNNIFTSKLI
ncbi:RNA-guided endonuclease InsQ/TnpB family protein [Fusobacterium massiliense]|uniref:RNA-guided endonuclease InsQ/TnpB family protein n=1 Tax=Fusobacterium massiliense TaxID=1852365 RepID=UPI00093BABCA|nr:RNA-guided endonuclease TnpB family protein [Fusobacterium massiliense]